MNNRLKKVMLVAGLVFLLELGLTRTFSSISIYILGMLVGIAIASLNQ